MWHKLRNNDWMNLKCVNDVSNQLKSSVDWKDSLEETEEGIN